MIPDVESLRNEGVAMAEDDDDDSTSTSSCSSSATAVDGAGVTQTLRPSHILQDGTFLYLPPPSDHEKTRFFERSIAKHGLLQDDLKTDPKHSADDETKAEEDDKPGQSAPKIHPLALASARLQSNGINELNRAINLHTLVATGEYFGLSNIVDPSLERVSASTKPAVAAEAAADRSIGTAATTVTAAAAAAAPEPLDEEEARVRALYVLKRKRAQFELASATLQRHRTRLTATVIAQQQVDQRLRKLRPVWMLVAPEHGTRALPHAVRPTEVVATDVDVYYGNRVGRLASRVPRYATIELRDTYTVPPDSKDWHERHFPDHPTRSMDRDGDTAMDWDRDGADTEDPNGEPKRAADVLTRKTELREARECTRAAPFVIADPALGKLDADFDPNKVSMLTLQVDIEKPSTGYCHSACLEPIASSSTDTSTECSGSREDEKLLLALQHSLFCAKLFESIRRELAPDTENIGQIRTTAKAQSAVWLTGESEENFLPPPSLMISGRGPSSGGLAPLCIVHVHEGDVKVLLDCEYSLRVRLVESHSNKSPNSASTLTPKNSNISSGSLSPVQLRTLCRTLLLHAQTTHHRHSVQNEAILRREQEDDEKRQAQFQKVNPQIKAIPPVAKKEIILSPCTLQSCVSLGTKMLFERRIRKTLRTVKLWLQTKAPASDDESLFVEWLALSVFDLTSQFVLSFRSWSIDANIVCDELTVTHFSKNGYYRKAKFHTDKEFEMYLKTAILRVLQASKES